MADDQPIHHRVSDAADLGIDGLADVSIIGSGGSATVYRARQTVLDRTVAVKVVHAAWSIETRDRFDHERAVMGRLSGHAAIVPIFETGMTNRGEPYLLMPFYRRGSLFRLLRDSGPLPWQQAAFIVEGLAQAVADLHDEGIVHRDIKPGNVMLTHHLQPRLSDFGISLPAGTPTGGNTIAYTPSYSPPEAHEPGTAATTTDVYGLGATLWALLAGRAPFTREGEPADGAAVMERSMAADLAPPSATTPEPIMALLRRCMHRDPSGRPDDAGAFRAELRRAVRLSEQADRPGLARLGDHRARLVTASLVTMVIAGVALLVLATLWLLAP